ncbi:MAG TPA: bifunctional hydroxymethylpyrimidine kinase/phosphomethylpyrimidine kinase [Kiritimatiellae bacterium]|nr:bifunctional hydroxymethylpyrimidine kinase/phosphomethylpyrimidine kinase [Kiritimatiellia bacterium]
MTIACSDSGGGAGIQADLKTFAALGVFGTSAVTCLTAQNPSGVTGIYPVSPEFVRAQILAVCESFPIQVAKTGMLFSAEIIRVVAEEDVREGIEVLVVDPVMVAASGARLLQAEAVTALCQELLPQARVITPNLHEAEILCGHSISRVEELVDAARQIGANYDVACVAKGGHLDASGDTVVDVLFDEGEQYIFEGPRIPTSETHGAGCAFSAALVAFLARGLSLYEAVEAARRFVSRAIEGSVRIGRHYPLNFQAASPFAVSNAP